MQKINSTDGRFVDGNPSTGALGTIVTAAWLNMIQDELISVLTAAGIALDGAKVDQLLSAIRTLSLPLASKVIGTAADLDNLRTNGFYIVFGANGDGQVLHLQHPNSTGYAAQLMFGQWGQVPTSSGNGFSYRAMVSGVWTGWQKIWHAGNFTPGNYAPLASPVFTGMPQVSNGPAATYFRLTSDAGQWRGYTINSGTQSRWGIFADTSAESGGNAGSNLVIRRYADDGSFIDAPISINRATGVVTFGASPIVPTAAPGTNTLQAASTAFVQAALAALVGTPPVGAPVPWPLSTPPTGWAICQGQTFSTATYPQLAVAYPSGVLPDLRGVHVVGYDGGGRGLDTLSLGQYGADQLPAHTHSALVQGGSSAHTVSNVGDAPIYVTNGQTGSAGSGSKVRVDRVAMNYIVRLA